MSEQEFVVDFGEAIERQLLPKNWYRLRCESGQLQTASTGTPMAVMMFRVVEGEYEGQPVFQNWPLKGKGAGITKSAVRALLGDAAADNQTAFSFTELVGAEAMAYITQRIYTEEAGGDGEPRNNLSRWKAIDYGAEGEEPSGLFSG